ncbi:MAG TPA: adenylate/guanylate cyclase domain-containing protein [Candidatus Limnocylindrales bacterium]|jgi:class 3 adenylate cyclase
MGSIRRRSLVDPDAQREFPFAALGIVRIGSQTLGYGVQQPGFRWSTHMGPAAGGASCPVHHLQVFLSGRFAVRMDDGEEVEFGALDVGDIPPGHDAWVVGDEPVHILDFAGNSDAIGMPREHERIVTTLLMTDIVDSTRTASRLGDAAWKQLLSDHNRLIRAQLMRFGGAEVNTTGDGFLATFRSAIAGLRCATAVLDVLRETGVEVRIGLHTGEVEIMGHDVGGVAVHAAARIMALAGASEIVASAVVVGLAEGSGLSFEGLGARQVKGLDRPIEVYRLVQH